MAARHSATLLAGLLATACAGGPTESRAPAAGGGEWRTQVAYEGDTKLGGVAAGDLLPDVPGDEILVARGDGALVLVRREGDGFAHEVVAETPGELVQVAVGDLVPTLPGDEAVAVGVAEGGEDDGGPGVARLVVRGPRGEWAARELLRDDELLHAVAIADLDPAVEGVELAVAGFTGRLHLLSAGGRTLRTEVVAEVRGNVKGMAPLTGGIALACDDGRTEIVRRQDDGSWRLAEGFEAPDALARITTRRGPRGEEILVCANDGLLRLYQGVAPGTPRSTTACVTSGDRLRGAVFADLDPNVPGAEAATAGYDGDVVVATLPVLESRSGEPVLYDPRATVVGSDTDRLHDLTAADLDGLGRCLVGCGYSGRVLVVRRVGD